MISENTISKVMSELGKRGTGKAKKRGNREYYQAIRAKRKDYKRKSEPNSDQ